MDNDDVDPSEVEIDVKDGEVTLRGEVKTRREKRIAEDCVECVSGVRDVNNQLKVRSGRSDGETSSEQGSTPGTKSGMTTSSSVSSKAESTSNNPGMSGRPRP
jgi:hypothetical protein